MNTSRLPPPTIIVLYSLGIFLGLLHIFFGVVSLTPTISQDYHRDMKINYNAFSKNLKFLHEVVDRVTLALYLRYFLSACQIVFGALLLENGHFGPAGRLGNHGLIAIDFIYLFFQVRIGSPVEKIAPTVVFTLLLLTRLYFVIQNAKRMKPGVKTRNAGKPKTSTPKKNKNE